MATKLIDLDKLQRLDHDAIIRVETKLDNISADFKIFNDGVNSRVNDHEGRIKKIEDLILQVNLLNFHNESEKFQQKVHDYITSANAIRMTVGIFSGIMGGVMTFILVQLPSVLKLLGWVK